MPPCPNRNIFCRSGTRRHMLRVIFFNIICSPSYLQPIAIFRVFVSSLLPQISSNNKLTHSWHILSFITKQQITTSLTYDNPRNKELRIEEVCQGRFCIRTWSPFVFFLCSTVSTSHVVTFLRIFGIRN